MRTRTTPLRYLAPLAAAVLVSGCGSLDSLMPHSEPNTLLLNQGANPRPVAQPTTNPSEKLKVLPVSRADINCPEIDVPPGAAALRIGGADNASVRYQFNIANTARECDPAGPGQATIKIGVSGYVVVGPAGSAGAYSAPLKITVTDTRAKMEVFSKTYSVSASTDGIASGPFRFVTDPIPVSMPTLQLQDVYEISVGFAASPESEPRVRRRKTAS